MLQAGRAGELRPRGVAGRELDGCPFDVLVLRTCDDGITFDVIYLDDGNIERNVPSDELSSATSPAAVEFSEEDFDRFFREGLERLESEAASMGEASTGVPQPICLTPSGQGRFVAEDGSVFLLSQPTSQASQPLVADCSGESSAAAASPAACGTGLRGIRSLRQRRLAEQSEAGAVVALAA